MAVTETRTHPVPNPEAHARVVAEYRQDGYTEVKHGPDGTTLQYQTSGSLLAHLALFFTVGWLTLGILNVWYAWRKRRGSRDRVRVVIQE